MPTPSRIRKAPAVVAWMLVGALGGEPVRTESLQMISRVLDRDTPLRSSWPLQWSESGRYLLIQSEATGLVPGQLDFEDGKDLFLLDLWKNQLVLLSRHYSNPLRTVGSNGLLSSDSFRPRMTSDAEFVVFEARGSAMSAGQVDVNGTSDIFLWDRGTDEIELVSHVAGLPTVAGDGTSTFASISDDGRFVAFASLASNLVPDATDTNGTYDVFVLDRTLGETRLVSRSSATPSNTGNGSSFAPRFRADGASLVFSSGATDLVPGVVDTNGGSDVFEWDAVSGAVALISSRFDSPLSTASGSSAFSERSSDDRFLAVTSLAPDLAAGVVDGNATWDVFLFDRTTGQRRLVSHQGTSTSTTGDAESGVIGLSHDGRYLTLWTRATDLVPGGVDTNGGWDVVQWDAVSGLSRLVSRAASSPLQAGNDECWDSSQSASGRYVSFLSLADDHVAGVTEANSSTDLFVWDRDTGTVRLVSHREGEPLTTGESGIFRSIISSGGESIVFNSVSDDYDLDDADGNGEIDNFVWSRFDDEVRLAHRLSEEAVVASGAGLWGMDASGRWILLGSNLYDLATGEMVPIGGSAARSDSIGGGGATGRFLSADGQCVLFQADTSGPGSTNAFHWCRDTGVTTLVSHAAASTSTPAGGFPVTLSSDGRFVVFDSEAPDIVAGQVDTDHPTGTLDVFLWDRTTNSSVLVSHLPGKPTTTAAGEGRLVSAAGEFVVFQSPPGNGQVFRFRRSDGQIELVSRAYGGKGTEGGDHASEAVAMSADGRFVAFRSTATNLVDPPVSPVYEQTYLYDAFDGSVGLLSRSVMNPANAGNQESMPLAISDDGSVVLLLSRASDLVPGLVDENNAHDLFLWHAGDGSLELVTRSASDPGVTANFVTMDGNMSGTGDRVAFASYATDLVAAPHQDTPGTLDAFLWSGQDQAIRLITGNVLDRSIAAGDAVERILISGSGAVVAFESTSIHLVSADRPFGSSGNAFAWLSGLFEDGFETGDASAWSDLEP